MDKESRNIGIECSTEMTNEEYREELKKMFEEVDNNALLQYFYILLPKLIKEWN